MPLALGLCNGIAPYVDDKLLNALVASASVVSFNDDEWEVIQRRMRLRSETGMFALAPALECIYHTCGTRPGTGYLRDEGHFEIPVRVVPDHVSAIGAGDTFMAGVLYGRLLGLDYAASAWAGSMLASLKVETALGATFPSSKNLELTGKLAELLHQHGIIT